MISCTFAGHRSILHHGIKERVSAILEKLAAMDDTFIFYSGGMGEFDALCDGAVRDMKKQYPRKNIRLILVEPYMKRSINTEGEYLLRLYDEIIIPEELECAHYKRAIPLRNRWMVDHSDYLIAYLHRPFGGAYETTQYAKQSGKTVFSILSANE